MDYTATRLHYRPTGDQPGLYTPIFSSLAMPLITQRFTCSLRVWPAGKQFNHSL